ncbi:MAG: response regulator [Ktedonobacteraceae bacterium]|nr:response regulator [Ktedonobacteraceae bacterium]MBO0789897.1 response regulator [Ktedonobacteraceae bacterium]
MPYGNKPLVLLVEADTSLQRLIALGLQHRGIQVITAAHLADLPPIKAGQPDLLILDIDRGVKSDWSTLAALRSRDALAHLPIITLSWAHEQPEARSQLMPSGVLGLSKPFDARALHSAIDQLLVTGITLTAEDEEIEEKALLASYSHQTAPSLLPLLTAAGLLTVVIGMLLQFTIAAAGVLLLFAALLLWTLGSRERTSRNSFAACSH